MPPPCCSFFLSQGNKQTFGKVRKERFLSTGMQSCFRPEREFARRRQLRRYKRKPKAQLPLLLLLLFICVSVVLRFLKPFKTKSKSNKREIFNWLKIRPQKTVETRDKREERREERRVREDLNLAVAMRWPTRRGKRERNKKKEEESLVSQMANISRMNAQLHQWR